MSISPSNCNPTVAARRRLPLCGAVSTALAFAGIAAPFVLGEKFGYLDIYLRDGLPITAEALGACGILRHERLTWNITGIVLAALYLGLHFVVVI